MKILKGCETIDKKMLRQWLKYYGAQIAEEYEWIKGLEDYNIDNCELDSHYDNMIEWIVSMHDKIVEYIES